MGEAIHILCLECKKDYGIKLTGRGRETVNNFLPGYCTTCKLIVTTKAENPLCKHCNNPITLCGRFVIETKKQWIKNDGSYKYFYSWNLLKTETLPHSLNNSEELSQLKTFSNFLEPDLKRLDNYRLSFEIDFKTKYDCRDCGTNNVHLGFGGMDWD